MIGDLYICLRRQMATSSRTKDEHPAFWNSEDQEFLDRMTDLSRTMEDMFGCSYEGED